MFRRVALFTALIITAIMPVIAIAQPGVIGRAVRNILVVDGMVAIALWLNSRGRVRAASWLYVLVILALITYNAPAGGGIRSPGVQAYFIFVMLAGLLLGVRAGIAMALICAALGLGLVVAERTGVLPAQGADYNIVTRWLLTCLYIGVALLTMQLAVDKVTRALRAAHHELGERRVAEERLDRALDAGDIGIFEHRIGHDRFYVDERALALMGLTPDPDGTVAIDSWLALVHPDDRTRVAAELRQFVQGKPHSRIAYRLIRPDGTLRHFEAAAHVAERENGQPGSVLGMVMDVTATRQAEVEKERLVLNLGERVKELRLLHEAARLLQHASGVDRLFLAELVFRMPGAWLHAADARARISYGDIEVTSEGWRETPWIQRTTFTTSEGVGVLEVAYQHEHPDAEEGPFLAEERALINSLAEMLRSHIERHVLERQRQAVEEQLRQAQRMDALGTLAGGIAHDFNNILTAIGVNAELAAMEAGANGALAPNIQEILKAHGRARDLVRRILLFSQRQESARQVIAVEPIVTEALQLLRATLPPNIEIRTNVAPTLPPVYADPGQLHQVMMNLGTNAAYAMREHGGMLSVGLDATSVHAGSTLSREVEPGPYLRLTVRDSGCGMSPEVRARLFEPFFTTKGQAGTGLGLSVVHGIVRDHRGTIVVTSEPDEGTQFDIYLRAADDDVQPPAAEAVPIVPGGNQHIMYVDDEESLSRVMTRTFVRLGYRCTPFTDPVVALHEFRSAPRAYDVVITDLQMPAMSGLDMARAVRAVRPDTPVAVISGYPPDSIATDPDVDTVLWISKPPTMEDLASALRELLERPPLRV